MTTQDPMPCGTGEEFDKLSPDYRAPALDKGLDILELLAQGSRPMTLARISMRLNKSNNELFRMVRVLERREYIEMPRDTTGYVLTDKLSRLGMARADSNTLLDYNLPAMRRVRELEDENSKLRRVIAELLRDNTAIPDFKSNTR